MDPLGKFSWCFTFVVLVPFSREGLQAILESRAFVLVLHAACVCLVTMDRACVPSG